MNQPLDHNFSKMQMTQLMLYLFFLLVFAIKMTALAYAIADLKHKEEENRREKK